MKVEKNIETNLIFPLSLESIIILSNKLKVNEAISVKITYQRLALLEHLQSLPMQVIPKAIISTKAHHSIWHNSTMPFGFLPLIEMTPQVFAGTKSGQ